jgi:hypothetical protein
MESDALTPSSHQQRESSWRGEPTFFMPAKYNHQSTPEMQAVITVCRSFRVVYYGYVGLLGSCAPYIR